MLKLIAFFQIFLLVSSISIAPAYAQDTTNLQQLQLNRQALEQFRRAMPSVRDAAPNAFSSNELPLEVQCGDSCLCKGAKDCVKLATQGCCGSSDITCDDSGCSCVNNGGCDANGN